ncbi:hypothetical protein GPJ59_30395, partial [Streptomyces bambusae]|nr:hypothetical protein [Streptomyces bambusae]
MIQRSRVLHWVAGATLAACALAPAVPACAADDGPDGRELAGSAAGAGRE